MPAFEFASPTTREDAIRLLSGGGTSLAGGTDLLGLVKDGIESPRRLVSLRRVADLRGIRLDGEGLRIGAMTSLEDLATHVGVARSYPALAHAVDGILSAQIRAMGPVGGDLCQRPRCWYFRNGFGLLARKDGRSLVLDGDSRFHAILGNAGPAYFVSESSLAPALVALGAEVVVAGPKGVRKTPVERFFRTPQHEGEREIDLVPGELLAEVFVPPAAGIRSATYEVRSHRSLDWPLAAAAVALHLTGDRIVSARVVLGHVAPVPWPAPAAESVLKGKLLDDATLAAAGEMAVTGAKPLPGNAYKIRLTRVAVTRALRAAVEKGA